MHQAGQWVRRGAAGSGLHDIEQVVHDALVADVIAPELPVALRERRALEPRTVGKGIEIVAGRNASIKKPKVYARRLRGSGRCRLADERTRYASFLLRKAGGRPQESCCYSEADGHFDEENILLIVPTLRDIVADSDNSRTSGSWHEPTLVSARRFVKIAGDC